MKRTLSLILIFTMLLSLAACGSKDAAPPDDDNAPPQHKVSFLLCGQVTHLILGRP